MFDSINLEEAINNIYDCGFKNDMLTLVYKANVKTHMAVSTPHGLTERQTVENTVLQGDTFGSILASVQVEKIGKYCEKSGYGYKYKNYETYNRSARLLFSNKCLSSNIKQV